MTVRDGLEDISNLQSVLCSVTQEPETRHLKVADLPVDILHTILSHLYYHYTDLNNLSRISRAWHHLATPYLYRYIELRSPSMGPQLRLQSLILRTSSETNNEDCAGQNWTPIWLVQGLTLGICPPSHAYGDFIYSIPQILSKLPNLRHLALERTSGTPPSQYTAEGNGNTPRRRFLRGEMPFFPSDSTEIPPLVSLKVDIPVGDTVHSIIAAQKESLRRLELWHLQNHAEPRDFIGPHVRQLALSGERIVKSLEGLNDPVWMGIEGDARWKPTHLALDYPSTTPLWPLGLRRLPIAYISLPNTTHLHSLEISSTLITSFEAYIVGKIAPVQQPSLDRIQIDSAIQETAALFPTLKHFGIFTSTLSDARFVQERQFLTMWSGGFGQRYEPQKEMVKLLRHVPSIESLRVQPEDVGDWMDTLVREGTQGELMATLRVVCARLVRVLWAKGEEGTQWMIRGENVHSMMICAEEVAQFWKYVR